MQDAPREGHESGREGSESQGSESQGSQPQGSPSSSDSPAPDAPQPITGALLRVLGILLGFALSLVLVVLFVVGLGYEPNTTLPEGVPGEHIEVLGVPLRVLVKAPVKAASETPRDVLLIHGSPGSVDDWEPIIAGLSPRHRVTAFDRPGHGYSGDSGQYSFVHNAKVASALIAQKKLERVIVVGHSYGGATALAMAIAGDPRVAGYVIVDSATYTPSRSPNLAMRAVSIPIFGLGIAQLAGARVAAPMIEAGLREQWSPGGRGLSRTFIARRTRMWTTPKVLHATAVETLEAKDNLEAQSPAYPGIKAPVQIVAQADNAFRRANAERLHRDIPGSTLELVRQTGHFVQFEKADAVLGAIERALAATAPERARKR